MLTAVALAILLALALGRQKLLRHIRARGEVAAKPLATEFGPTVQTALLTAMAALVLPGFLWFLGWVSQSL